MVECEGRIRSDVSPHMLTGIFLAFIAFAPFCVAVSLPEFPLFLLTTDIIVVTWVIVFLREYDEGFNKHVAMIARTMGFVSGMALTYDYVPSGSERVLATFAWFWRVLSLGTCF